MRFTIAAVAGAVVSLVLLPIAGAQPAAPPPASGAPGLAQTGPPPASVATGLPPNAPAAGSPPPGAAGTEPPAQAASPPAPAYPRIKVGALAYLAMQAGNAQAVDSVFLIKRSYINLEADMLPYLSARVTPDVYADDDGIEFRLKYAYAQLRADGNRFVTRPTFLFGMVPTPWFMFEEQVNRYRMQDAMFIERSGQLDSADTGLTVSGLFGGMLADEARAAAGNHDAGRYGSFAFGVYNGGGYTSRELNSNKVVQGRLTARPLPDVVPGLQFSVFIVEGAGNTPAAPDWDEFLMCVTWEHPRLVLTAQRVSGKGNQAGTQADTGGEAWPHAGWSAFGDLRLHDRWSVIGRFDDFDADTRVDNRRFRRMIGGVAYRLGGNNRLLVDMDHRDWLQPGRNDETRFQVTLQISF